MEYKHWHAAQTDPFQLGVVQYLLCSLCHSGKHAKMPTKIQFSSDILKGNYRGESVIKEKEMRK